MSNTKTGLHADLPHLVGRRHALCLMGAAVALPSAARASCVADAAETAGPFPSNGTNRASGQVSNLLREAGIVRDDMRRDFAGLTGQADGTALRLRVSLVASDAGCAPLAERPIYLWQCDAAGRYSVYEEPSHNYLRGVAITDANGQAEITTIFPGCYAGRWPHIHYQVFTSADRMMTGRDAVLTGQIAFDGADCERLYAADEAYARSIPNLAQLSFKRDMIFRNDSADQNAQRLVALSGGADDLSGTVTIGL